MTLMLLLFSMFTPALPFQTFDVLGTVRDNTGQAVNSIRVSLVDDSYQPIRTVFTDTSGRFVFRGLVSGRYLVRIEPAGQPFEEQTMQLDLQAIRQRGTGSEPYPIDIVVKRKRSPNTATESAGTIFAQTVPPDARSEYERGVDSVKSNKPDEAIACLKKAIDLFPDYFLALELLGTEMVKHSQFEPAVPVLTHALEVNHSAPKSLYALGVADLKLGRAGEAIPLLKSAAQLDAANPNVFMMLGIAYGNNREMDEAESALKKAYELGREMAADAHLYLAGIYNKRENFTEAARELELYLKEAKDLKDTTQIRTMISKMKEKEKAKKK